MGDSLERWDPTGTNDPPVTAVASRRVKQGHEEEFEEWVVGITAAAAQFPGYLGSNIFQPRDPDDDEYQIVFGFDHASNLERWQGSEERRRWNAQARDLIHEEPRVRVLTGLETWFTLPSKEGAPPPPRYKMTVVTWLAVFPLATVVFMLLNPLLGGFSMVGSPWCSARCLHDDDGLAHDLCSDAAYDPPLLLLALPQEKVRVGPTPPETTLPYPSVRCTSKPIEYFALALALTTVILTLNRSYNSRRSGN